MTEVIDYDANGRIIHCKKLCGFEFWKEYDSDGNEVLYRNSRGYAFRFHYDANGKMVGSTVVDCLLS